MDFKKLIKISYLTISSLTLISTVLLLLSFSSSFDMINGYFTDGILPVLFKIFFVLGILLSITPIIFFHKKGTLKTPNGVNEQKYIFLAFAGIILALAIFYGLLISEKNFTISIIGACLFAGFVIICSIKNGYEYHHIKLVCLLFSSLFSLLMIIDNNSVMVRHSNSVENLLSSVFGIAFLVYILYEGKRLFAEEHSPWHLASMLALTHTGFSLSISYMIVYLTGKATETKRFYQMTIIFVICAFVEIELIRFIKEAKLLSKEENSEKTDN